MENRNRSNDGDLVGGLVGGLHARGKWWSANKQRCSVRRGLSQNGQNEGKYPSESNEVRMLGDREGVTPRVSVPSD